MRKLLLIPLLIFGCGEGPMGGKDKVRVKVEAGTDGERGQPGADGADGGVGAPGEKGDAGDDGSAGTPGDEGAPGTPGDPGNDGEQGGQGEPGNDGQSSSVRETETEVIFIGGNGSVVIWPKPAPVIITICWCDRNGNVKWETGEALYMLIHFFGDPQAWVAETQGNCGRPPDFLEAKK
jgi:hypothetical protein